MQYVELKSNVLASLLCFGCEPLGGTDWGEYHIQDIHEAIDLALDKGVNFFDTADVYGLGLSETRLAQALGDRRHDVIIATKGGVSWQDEVDERAVIQKNCSAQYLASAINNSLKRLKIDKIPVYYVHWPDDKNDLRYTFEFLNKMQAASKIGLIGCSNFKKDQLSLAASVSDISVLQIPMNIIDRDWYNDVLDVCTNNNINIIPYNVLSSGLLSGKFNADTQFKKNDRRSRLPLFQGEKYIETLAVIEKLKKTAFNQNMSLSQFSINWAITQPQVSSVITGIKNIKQLNENIDFF